VDIEPGRMATAAGGWSSFALVPDSEVCARARRAIQERQIQLASFSRIHDDEIEELDTALRDVWVIEEKNRKR